MVLNYMFISGLSNTYGSFKLRREVKQNNHSIFRSHEFEKLRFALIFTKKSMN